MSAVCQWPTRLRRRSRPASPGAPTTRHPRSRASSTSPKKKTAKPVARLRRFIRPWTNARHALPRGAVRHSPWKDHVGLVRLRDPRSPSPSPGADRPCAWTSCNESPAAPSCQHSPREGGASSRRTSSQGTPGTLQRLSPPRGTFRSLSAWCDHHASLRELSASARKPASAVSKASRWIGWKTWIDSRAPQRAVADARRHASCRPARRVPLCDDQS